MGGFNCKTDTEPTGIYDDIEWPKKVMKKMIKKKKVAPFSQPKANSKKIHAEECPICMYMFLGGLNECVKCKNRVCSECYFRAVSPDPKVESHCPFCSCCPFKVVYKGVLSNSQIKKRQDEENKVKKLEQTIKNRKEMEELKKKEKERKRKEEEELQKRKTEKFIEEQRKQLEYFEKMAKKNKKNQKKEEETSKGIKKTKTKKSSPKNENGEEGLDSIPKEFLDYIPSNARVNSVQEMERIMLESALRASMEGAKINQLDQVQEIINAALEDPTHTFEISTNASNVKPQNTTENSQVESTTNNIALSSIENCDNNIDDETKEYIEAKNNLPLKGQGQEFEGDVSIAIKDINFVSPASSFQEEEKIVEKGPIIIDLSKDEPIRTTSSTNNNEILETTTIFTRQDKLKETKEPKVFVEGDDGDQLFMIEKEYLPNRNTSIDENEISNEISSPDCTEVEIEIQTNTNNPAPVEEMDVDDHLDQLLEKFDAEDNTEDFGETEPMENLKVLFRRDPTPPLNTIVIEDDEEGVIEEKNDEDDPFTEIYNKETESEKKNPFNIDNEVEMEKVIDSDDENDLEIETMSPQKSQESEEEEDEEKKRVKEIEEEFLNTDDDFDVDEPSPLPEEEEEQDDEDEVERKRKEMLKLQKEKIDRELAKADQELRELEEAGDIKKRSKKRKSSKKRNKKRNKRKKKREKLKREKEEKEKEKEKEGESTFVKILEENNDLEILNASTKEEPNMAIPVPEEENEKNEKNDEEKEKKNDMEGVNMFNNFTIPTFCDNNEGEKDIVLLDFNE